MDVTKLPKKVPDIRTALEYLKKGSTVNEGPWIEHSLKVGEAAKIIASYHPDLDEDVALVLGCLHDIGRSQGVMDMKHIVVGYQLMMEAGYDDAARICMTHSFQYQDINSYMGNKDVSQEELRLITRYIKEVTYDEYDYLIQLCDSLAGSNAFCLIEKRLMDVAFRYGVNPLTLKKWKATIALKDRFEAAIGRNIYSILPGVVEGTFNS